jgi:hypothetical protein
MEALPRISTYPREQVGLRRLDAFGLRMKVWWSKDGLTRELAAGADSLESRELALRAGQLTAKQTRALVACSLEDMVEQSTRSRSPFTAQVPVNRRKVRAARKELLGLIARLRSAELVTPRGMARVLLLLTDPELPLYGRASKEQLAHAIIDATECLDASRPAGWS